MRFLLLRKKLIELLRNYNDYRKFLKFFTTTKVQSQEADYILRLKAKIAGGTVKLKATAFMREKDGERGYPF